LCDCNYRAPTKLSKNKDTHYRCLPWQLASFISVISSQSFSTALACLDSLTLTRLSGNASLLISA
jgi:hypothetical protein